MTGDMVCFVLNFVAHGSMPDSPSKKLQDDSRNLNHSSRSARMENAELM